MSSKKTGWPKTYTTAQADYDWFGTHTDEELVGWTKTSGGERNKPIRSVRSDPKYVNSQRQRYMSGNHMAVDVAEWKKLVGYKLVILASEPLQENPSGGAVAALIGLGVLVAGWLVLSPKKASAAPAGAPPPALPPAQVQPPLPPAPPPQPAPAELPAAKPQPAAPIPEQPLTQTGGCEYAVHYKPTADTEPLLFVHRRFTVWHDPGNPSGTIDSYQEQGWLPMSQRSVGLYYGEFGGKFKDMALLYYSTVYFLAEMWVWTVNGWCLDATTRNYTSTQPSPSAPAPEATQAPSQLINQPPQATNP